MQIEYKKTLNHNPSFGHIGKPTEIFENSKYIIVASSLNYTQWPARDIESRKYFGVRVTIFDKITLEVLACTDAPRFSINDIAFHSQDTVLALATGDYDGGYSFEGELLLWNWATNEIRSILDSSVEVLRCRFSNNDETIDFITHPPDEGDFEEDCFDKFFYFENIPVSTFKYPVEFSNQVKPEDVNFDMGEQDFDIVLERLQSLAKTTGCDYEVRTCVWDLDWLDQDSLITTSDEHIIELWSLKEGRVFAEKGKSFNGFEIALLREENIAYINTVKNINLHDFDEKHGYSKLLSFNLEEKTTKAFKEMDYPVTMSLSVHGSLLLRRASYDTEGKKDLLINGQVETGLDLGHYDLFNHYIRINNQESLYCIQGKPKNQHENKHLVSVNPESKVETEHWPLTWEEDNPHLMQGIACILDDKFISSFEYHHPSNFKFNGFIAARELSSGELLWSFGINAQTTVLETIEEYNLVFYALANGEIGLIDLDNGKIVYKEVFKIDDINSCAISASYMQGQIAVGTIDGRVVILGIN